MSRLALLILATACRPDEPADDSAAPTGPDLSEVLGADEARAGVVEDDTALFGGIDAEGRAGDVKIYNDRAAFIIQGVRDGSFLFRQGGGVIDADRVRDAAAPGYDFVDEWVVATGPMRIMDPETVAVVDDGSGGGPATVHVEGPESPIDYLTGAFESDDLIPDTGVWFSTDFTLEPGTPLMRVTTTYTATEQDVSLQPGDIIFGSKELGQTWTPGLGLSEEVPDTYPFVAFVGRRNEGVVGVFGTDDSGYGEDASVAALAGLLAISPAYGERVELLRGESHTVERYYGVGRDLAELTDAWLTALGADTEEVSGTVEAPDGPVAGARVTVLVDGAPFTLAFTREDGSFSALVPAGAEVGYVADGRGRGIFPDLPSGYGAYSPYTTEAAQQAALASYAGEGDLPVQAAGRGVSAADDPLTLAEPGTLVLHAADGLPFEARLSASGLSEAEEGLAQDHPQGYAALAWARDGEVELPLEPGSYSLLVHRGPTWEIQQQDLEVAAGEELTVEVDLSRSVAPEGWLTADPHVHAAPSPDSSITMEERLVVAAGTGVQLQFGTDHDHIVDYSPLLAPLGLDGVMHTITATEFSPVKRGHVNCYPLHADPTKPNGGALRWWLPEERVQTTQEEFDRMAEVMPDALFQVNHPLSGLASLAGWSPGEIAHGDYWTEDFDVIEVNNGGGHAEETELYLDLVSRGIVVAPVSVSDSHKHLSSSPGFNITWIHVGEDDPAAVTDDAIVEALTAHATVASTGPFLDLSIEPGSTVVGPQTLDVRALTPSWFSVDRLTLVQNDEAVETVEGDSATFTLDPDEDALYVVVAEGDAPMSPVNGLRPWALSAAILVDADGDGWSPPLPPLVVDP